MLLALSLVFVLQVPSSLFSILEEPLKSQGIYYGKIEGSLLSGFILHDVNYQEKIKAKSVALKIDLEQLENRVLLIDRLLLDSVEIDKEFLAKLIDDNSNTKQEEESNVSLPFDKVIVNNLVLSLENTRYENFDVKYAKLKVKNFESDMKKRHKGEVTFVLDSNITQVDLNAKIINDRYELNAKIKGEQSFLTPILKEYNLKLMQSPKLDIKANGNFEKVNFFVKGDDLSLNYERYKVKTEELLLDASYDLKKQDIQVNLDSKLTSNIANVNMKVKSFVNLKDVNKSLSFKINTEIKPKKILAENDFIKRELQAQNIMIEVLPTIDVLAKGDMNNVDFNLSVQKLKIIYDRIDIELNDLALKGISKPLNGQTKLNVISHFDSSAVGGELLSDADFNFNDIEKSLRFDLQTELLGYDKYLNTLLKEHNLSLLGNVPLALSSSGTLQQLKLKTKVSTRVIYEETPINLMLDTQEIAVDLVNKNIDGSLRFNAEGKALNIDVESTFSGAYMNPKLLDSHSSIKIVKFDAFELNLQELLPLNLELKSSKQGLKLDLNAKKIEAEILSLDYNDFNFRIKSDAIYPARVMKLPKELKGKFIQVDLRGDVGLREKYFTLDGFMKSNKNFKLQVNAFSQLEGLSINVSSKHLNLEAKGNLEREDIKAKITIDSVKKLQKELINVYPFKALDVEGAMQLDVQLEDEKIDASLLSSKLVFDSFSIEEVEVKADYQKELLSIEKFNFKTRGFKEKRLNKNFYLNQKAFVHLGEQKELLFDMHPKIILKAKGDDTKLKALIQVESLPLGHPNYGYTDLSCDIDYLQEGKKKKIIGGVFLDKLKVFYESKFLDPSHDNDVIIVQKNKSSKILEDTFLNDVFIDLGIYASEAKYRTKDIELKFDVHLKAQKKFKKNLKLLGKVKEINGRVEQSPKVFSVVDSNIVFQGGKEINPLLDLTVEYELPDIVITINIHGNAKRPKITFTSEPPLPKKDILSYLLLGVSTAGLGEGKGSLGREAELFIMNQAARDLAYEVELDRVFIKDDGTGEGYAVQVGKKVNDNTMFIIENSIEGNSFILEYDVNKNIKVEVGQHQKVVPSQSIDVFFRKRFK